MGDSIYDKMSTVSAKEIADSLTGQGSLSAEQRAAADLNHDGQVDAEDVRLMAKAELELANRVSQAVDGLAHLSNEELEAADRNHDGHVDLQDALALQKDAIAARQSTQNLP